MYEGTSKRVWKMELADEFILVRKKFKPLYKGLLKNFVEMCIMKNMHEFQ